MNRIKVLAAAAAMGSTVAFADVTRATSPITVDGRLDEPAWKAAQWEHDMKRLSVQQELGPFARRTEFAFVHDGHTLYFAMRGYEKDMARYAKPRNSMIWGGDPVEVFLAPTGSHFDHYQFAVAPFSKQRYAAFYSEGGGIQPDPYAPDWRHAFYFGEKDAWTVEIAIPLSSLYMTRNAGWKTTWRVNVTRSMSAPVETASWAQMQRVFNEPEHLGTMGGFPLRAAGDDFAVLTVFPEVTGAAEKRIDAKLHLKVHAEVAGAYRVKVGTGAEQAVTLASGDNELAVDAAFPANGRHQTQIVFTRAADGARFERGYPVIIDHRPIRVKLTTPQYRNNFYPGQSSDRVAGEIVLGKGVTGEVTLTGPGFGTRTATVTGRGTVDFDTKGFAVGEATLRVKTAEHELAVPIRKLAPTARVMTWVEDGHLVQNGKPVLRRNVYALGYRAGRKLDEKYKLEMEPLVTRELDSYRDISPGRLVRGLNQDEAVYDIVPCKKYFDLLDAEMDKAKDDDFLGWYICDEPECSGISPVYLRHIYEHIVARDPYHVVFTASRGGKTYVDCADLFETHPYLSPNNAPDGTRSYGTPPWKMGDYLDAFGVWDRPDKVVGYLPTAFAYRWVSLTEDYPTFDEYRCCTWAAMMRGGKTLWPYAGHDIGDRPGIWDGTICIFESFRALQDFILLGKRTTFAKTEQVEGAHYALPDAEMFVVVNKKPTPATIELKGLSGNYREFRGARRFRDGETVSLQPFEVVIATTKPYDAGLRPLAEVRAKALADEYARTHRDNQLLERDADIGFESNFVGSHCGTWCKLFDGAYDQLARSSTWLTDCYIGLTFKNGLKPKVRTLRVHGSGIFDRVVASVWRDGRWVRLTPVETKVDRYLVTLRFDKAYETERLRLDFPGEKGARNELEVYEIEVPAP